MERLFVECAIRAALLVGGTGIVLYVMQQPSHFNFRTQR